MVIMDMVVTMEVAMVLAMVVTMVVVIMVRMKVVRNLQRRQRSAPCMRPLSEKPMATQSLWSALSKLDEMMMVTEMTSLDGDQQSGYCNDDQRDSECNDQQNKDKTK